MVEIGQDLPLAGKALRQVVDRRLRPDNLNRDLEPDESIITLRQLDHLPVRRIELFSHNFNLIISTLSISRILCIPVAPISHRLVTIVRSQVWHMVWRFVQGNVIYMRKGPLMKASSGKLPGNEGRRRRELRRARLRPIALQSSATF
jgi:hypothetical protein